MSVERKTTPELTWDRISVKEMRLSRASALLLVQGGSLSQLFPPDLTLYADDKPVLWFLSPLVLLARQEPNLFQVPPKVKEVVLGVVVRSRDLSEDDVRARMLADVLG